MIWSNNPTSTSVELIWYQLFPVRLLQTLVFWTGFSSVITKKLGLCHSYLFPGIKHLLWELSDLDWMQTYFCNKILSHCNILYFHRTAIFPTKSALSERKKGSDQDWRKIQRSAEIHIRADHLLGLFDQLTISKKSQMQLPLPDNPITWGCLWRSWRVEEWLWRLGCALHIVQSNTLFHFPFTHSSVGRKQKCLDQ